ncbi:MAG: tetratricopeptide repeat protein [Microgenomates group bacterium]|jgi:tetratricopeptide (TPR) repeat protein
MTYSNILSFLNKKIVHIIVLLLIVAAAYVNIFQNDFAFDDPTFITGWKDIQTTTEIPYLLKGSLPLGHTGLYRPLRSMFYVLSYHLWGENTFGYHLQSLFIIISLTLLTYLIVSNLTKKHFTAMVAAMLFGLHPIHTESITFMTASFDAIGTVFFFLSFYLYIKYRNNSERVLFLLSILTATIAFFTYEVTLTLPLLLFLYDSLFLKKSFQFKSKIMLSQISPYIPYLTILAFYLYTRMFYLQIVERGAYLLGSPFITFLVQVQAITLYIRLLFLPVNLTVNHLIAPGIVAFTWAEISEKALRAQSLFSIEVLTSIILIISIFTIAIVCFRTRSWVTFCIFWFFISLAPVLNIIPQGAVMTERYLLIPSFGFCTLIAVIIGNVYKLKAKNLNYKYLIITFLIITSGFFFIQTVYRNSEWRSSITLWESANRLNSNSYINVTNLAVGYAIANNPQKALNLFQKAENIASNNYHTHQNLGVQYFKMKKYDLAIEEYYKTIQLEPKLSYLYTALSVAYLEKEDYDRAITSSKKAIEVSEGLDPMAYFHLGEAYSKQNRTDLAIDNYKKALHVDPKNPTTHFRLGYTYYEQGKYKEAISEYEEALIFNPKSSEIYYNMGKSLESLNRPDLALQQYKKAIELDPKSAAAHNNAGIIYTGYNRSDEAEKEFNTAISLDPNLAEAYFNLAYIYKTQNKIDLATIQLQKGLLLDPTNEKAKKLLN